MIAVILINSILSAAVLGGLAFVMSRPRSLRVEHLHAARPAIELTAAEQRRAA